MSAEITEAMKLRAVAIADECMRSDVECHGVPIRNRTYGLSDDKGAEVKTLGQAGALLREAFQWLLDRGLAHLESDEAGEVIVLTPLPTAGSIAK